MIRLLAVLAVLMPGALPAKAGGLDEMKTLLTGSFTSAEQAASEAGYLEVEAEAVRIWPEREDGLWLYREQAILSDGGSKEQPYFQRIVHVYAKDDGQLVRDVYRLPDQADFVGAYAEPERFAGLSPEDLVARDGCQVRYERIAAEVWISTTGEGTCPSSLRGASTMTGRGVIAQDLWVNWDRGFNDKGEVVWGPKGGGYIFKRR